MKKLTIISIVLIATTITTNAQWVQQTSGTINDLWGVSFVDQNIGFICGDTGTILKTIDGGTNWLPQNSGTTYQLTCLQFIDSNTGYCASWFEEGGVLLKTINGGTTWNDISLNLSNAIGGEIWFFDADTGFMALGQEDFDNSIILKTVNGGDSWDTVYYGGAGWISLFHFPDSNNGYATMNFSRVLKTTDGGDNWTLLNNLGGAGDLWMSGVYFFNNDTGFVGGGDYTLGGGSIFKTTNGGNSWQCLSDEYGTSKMLFTTSEIGYAIGTNLNWNVKRIIKTTDSGASWSIENTPYVSMSDISFPSANIGYAVGDSGTILKITGSASVSGNIVEECINIYPNPASGFIILNINNTKNEDIKLYIYTVTGILVRSEMLIQYQQQINVDDLSNGIYMIKIKSKDLTVNKKLIIQR